MCANYSNFESITNYDLIMKMDDKELAGEFLNWFSNGYDETYIADFGPVYDRILEWLREPAERW